MDPISFFSSSASNNSIINFDDAFSSLMLDDCDESSLSYAAALERYTNFPLSPPTLIIPSTGASSSSTTPTSNNNSHTTHTKNCTNIGGSNVIETPTRGASAGGGCCSAAGQTSLLYDEMMMMCRSSCSKNCSTMLKLDADSVMNDWDEYLDNNTNRNHNNNNSNSSIINNNNNHHNNYTNTNNNVNIRSTDEQDTQDLLNILQNNNNNGLISTHTISQDYLGSVLANCTSVQVSKRGAIHHSKSPSLGSLNNRGGGIKKGSHQRSNSCYQAISYSNSMMHNNGQPTIGFNMMNVGLSSPSVTSTCSSTIAVSPANVSTNSFANTQHMISNVHGQPYLASVNNQYSTVVNNQPQPSIGSNKKGKIPAHRQDKNQINGKGLLVEANPNDKPIKMKQDKVKELGIKIHFEDGISKNKKDTGLQFHTCSFK